MEILNKIKESKLEGVTRWEIRGLKKANILEILDYKGIEYKKSWKKEVLLELTGILELLRPQWERNDEMYKKEMERVLKLEQEEKNKLLKIGTKIIKFEKENEVNAGIELIHDGYRMSRRATRLMNIYQNLVTSLWCFKCLENQKHYIYDSRSKKVTEIQIDNIAF